jgi:hypothetical protein
MKIDENFVHSLYDFYAALRGMNNTEITKAFSIVHMGAQEIIEIIHKKTIKALFISCVVRKSYKYRNPCREVLKKLERKLFCIPKT